jgi:hypothetical protein
MQNLEDVLVIWTGKVRVKNERAAVKVTEEQVKVIGQRIIWFHNFI